MATPFQLSDPAVPELLRARMLDRVEERLRGLLAAEHSATRGADPGPSPRSGRWPTRSPPGVNGPGPPCC
ncbi:hypothetical protein ACFQ0T_09760 [Kitasatospora gansuensis]